MAYIILGLIAIAIGFLLYALLVDLFLGYDE